MCEKHYKLDEIGFVGTQGKSSFKKELTAKTTGKVFRAARKVRRGKGEDNLCDVLQCKIIPYNLVQQVATGDLLKSR